MFLKFTTLHAQKGTTDFAYFSTDEIVMWNEYTVPDEGPRHFRQQRITVLTMKSGLAYWLSESFDSVSQRIIEALTSSPAAMAAHYNDAARRHAEAAQKAAEKKSPLAV